MLAAACTGLPPGPPTAPAPPPAPLAPSELPGWTVDDLASLAQALSRQCAMTRPPAPWPALCRELSDRPALRDWIQRRFIAWPLVAADGSARGLITGYHDPLLTGSRQRENDRQVPLYARPKDLLVTGADGQRGRREGEAVQPYWTRAQIETGALLAGQEIVWLDDPVEAFFLHVQGSGRVRLRDGSLLRVGFADHNGQPYRAIGRELIDRGALQAGAVDADAIKDWLRRNPGDAPVVMRANPRYVFFRVLPPAPPDTMPPGSLGVPLTAARSVATDPRLVPPGALLWLDTTRPDTGRNWQRAVISQDTGAAIVGAVRADVFWGADEQAARLAATMRQPGRLWLLWPRDAGAPPLPR